MKPILENIPKDAPTELTFSYTPDLNYFGKNNLTQKWKSYTDGMEKYQGWFFVNMRKPISIREEGKNGTCWHCLDVRNFMIEKMGNEDFGEYWVLYSEVDVIYDGNEETQYIVWRKEEAGICPSPFPINLTNNPDPDFYQDLDYNHHHLNKTGEKVESYLYDDFVQLANNACWLFENLKKPEAWEWYFWIIKNQLMDEDTILHYQKNMTAHLL